MRPIPYGRQDISEEDIQAVIEVLHSDWLTQGPAVEKFEQDFAGYCGAPYAVAVNSATSALHLACLALDLGPGDWLWTSPNTFVASANCARYCGANVDFVDIDPRTYNLSVTALEEKLRLAEKAGTLPKIVVPVHFSGQPCEMRAIKHLADRYNFRVIEDASHAVGACYLGSTVGNCRFSDVTVFSFHPVKILTTGEGGMVLTRDAELYQRLKQLRSHGVVRDSATLKRADQGAWYYEQHSLGYNFRITDIQCALGSSQLRRLQKMLARRRELAKRYDYMLTGLPLQTPWQSVDSTSAWHLYVVKMAPGINRRRIFDGMRSAGIGVNVHYIPVHTQPYYQSLGFKYGDFPEAEAYYAQAISLPIYSGLTEEDQDYVISNLHKLLT
ncbi:MAG TPA: UDP-4-amino-4,6-dideoxy-N-acetyl-beta-L-altrosamine transaminase [Nevskiales bacterium]|nr:UDP-4-amino-4,6-dideoxy-N-acetyl-beta-L-altrosamine transaminase [Nevskiales bacterium]